MADLMAAKMAGQWVDEMAGRRVDGKEPLMVEMSVAY